MGAPPINQHRIELLEQGLGDLYWAIAAQMFLAVNAATQEMQKTLFNQLTTSLEQTDQRLEARIARSREHQESFGEQEKFQAEMRSSLTSLKTADTIQGEGGGPVGATIWKRAYWFKWWRHE